MPLQSRKSLATLTGVKRSTSQCELRSTFPNLRVTNVIRIVTYYTLPPLESPDSSWMTRSQRSRRRDKGLDRPLSRRLDRCDRMIQNESRNSNGGNVRLSSSATCMSQRHCDVCWFTRAIRRTCVASLVFRLHVETNINATVVLVRLSLSNYFLHSSY